MFSIRTANSIQPASKRGRRGSFLSRKLRVEKMECRTMLSGTPLQFVPLELNIGQFAVFNLEYIQASTPVAKYASNEGGFINVDAFKFHDDIAVTRAAGTAGALANYSNVIPSNREDFTRGTLTLDTTNDFADWTVMATDGLQPATLGSYDDATEFGPSSPTLVINPTEDQVGQNEGGAIPLHPIVAGIRDELALASRDSVAAGSARLNSQSPARLVAASEKAMSGEWARAAIFEFASDDAASHDSAWSIDQPDPSAATQSTRASDESLHSAGIGQANVTAKPGDSAAQQPSTHSAAASQATETTLAVNNPTTQKTGVVLVALTTSGDAAKSNGDTDALATVASDTVFDQLAADPTAFVESSSDRGAWSRSRIATPILMILALERIAAINSRRATKERDAEKFERPRLRRS